MDENDFDKLNNILVQRLNIQVLNDSTSSVDFSLDNINLLEDLEIINEFIEGFYASGTETFETTHYEQEIDKEISKQLEEDSSIVDKFMEKYGDEWRRLGED